MNSENLPVLFNPSAATAATIVEIQCTDRWAVYFRLQELDIPCWCGLHQPLKVEIQGPIAALQVWSVVQQTSQSRAQLATHLEACWRCRHV